MSDTPRTDLKTYQSWCDMKQRCLNPKNHAYHNYGNRGIAVCERWMVYENFLADMGPKPPGLTLEREDNDAGYKADNCKWATPLEQRLNTRDVRFVEIGGVKKPISHFAIEFGINPRTVFGRLRRGWDVVRAIITPADQRANPYRAKP